MYIKTDSVDFIELLPIFFAVLVGLLIVVAGLYYLVKRQDNNKELITREVKILEKPVQQGHIEWYVVECKNGERIKLRSFQANNIIIAVGDEGMLAYKRKNHSIISA